MIWHIAEQLTDTTKTKYPGIDPVILQLLHNRNIMDPDEVNDFIHPDYKQLHDPFLFRDMQKAVDRIRIAQEKNDQVWVYGDYDADGVCSTVVMTEGLRAVGITEPQVYIPHREQEGYGLNTQAIDYIAQQGGQLIITVDCGTSNHKEVAHARSKGIDVIIVDHHEEPETIPQDLVALLNPHITGETYPFKKHAAVGVVFKVVQALWKAYALSEGTEKWLLDLVAIATVSDMMPLIGENRVYVKYGLIVLNKTQRVGLQQLIGAMGEQSGELGVYDIGFKIGPRLNAAGRLDHANTAYDLLHTQDATHAVDIAQSLNDTNTQRQSETLRIVEEAKQQVSTQKDTNTVLVARGTDWPVGVVGLASGRITDAFWRPSLVVTQSDHGLVGSGRSIPGFNITEALHAVSEHLEKFGGHEGACGFTVKSEEDFEPFVQKLNEYAKNKLSEKDLIKKLNIDLALTLAQITLPFIKSITELAPFGMGNPTPVFATQGVVIENIFLMGSEKQHMKLTISKEGETRTAVAFGFGHEYGAKLSLGDTIDLAYTVDINEWNNKKEPQLKVVDILCKK